MRFMEQTHTISEMKNSPYKVNKRLKSAAKSLNKFEGSIKII